LKNDHQLLIEMQCDRQSVQHIRFHPVFIHRFRTLPAEGPPRDFIIERMSMLCRELGTRVAPEDLSIHPAGSTDDGAGHSLPCSGADYQELPTCARLTEKERWGNGTLR